MTKTEEQVCGWCGTDPLYRRYHDEEWGVPCADDRILFEFLILESAQAGLNWLTVLRKREGYRAAFANFNAKKVAGFDEQKIEALLLDPGIVRNRKKVESAVSNARLFLEIQREYGSFARYMWGFLDDTPQQNQWESLAQVPATTPLSDAISKDMKKRGFRFFGSTICYAHLQALGFVNDHLLQCFRHRECTELGQAFIPPWKQ
ncbi:DNA-3-methyladenine glycosylase I [Spongiibacter sp. KMU-166]|uniref:DNA-3-methyladenine glycosylase I n=1 Tax=Spongiibacter thalassae TaxID=2721624 RepID=A0ABX1GM13_9GAMM|nr:DNA-3-methyladenine glycosylase I [Spongiibacter thalassae]NKI19508.1 DNA-3-methyladenine glycosylase I [Spongiibacter thalassae]